MKITHKILLINAALGLSLLAGTAFAACETGTNAGCSGSTPFCAYPNRPGPWIEDTQVCMSEIPNYNLKSLAGPCLAGFTLTGRICKKNCDGPTILPPAAPYAWPTVMPTAAPSYSDPAKVRMNCPKGIPEYYDMQTRTFICMRFDQANVFEAFWNFITHKRAR